MAFRRFEDILAWQQARTLVSEIYSVTTTVDTLRRDLRLTDRLQGSSISVMSSIAKGFATGTPAGFAENLRESITAATELQSLLYVCADLERIDRRLFDRLTQMTQICIRMLKELYGLLLKKLEQRAQVKSAKEQIGSNNVYVVSEPSGKNSPTRRSRAYSHPDENKPVEEKSSSDSDMEELERPDMTYPFERDDILDSPN
ncbi:four helix bundle protein [bacterium]|nr:four helix bundle protein [candidate division CSSED10-310 bacterium]